MDIPKRYLEVSRCIGCDSSNCTVIVFQKEPRRYRMSAVARFVFHLDRFDRVIVESMHLSLMHYWIKLHEVRRCIMKCDDLRLDWKQDIEKAWHGAKLLSHENRFCVDCYQFYVEPSVYRRAIRASETENGKEGWEAISRLEYKAMRMEGQIVIN